MKIHPVQHLLTTLFCAAILVGNAEGRPLTSHEIVATLPDRVTIVSNDEESYFEFCPDNTCDLIRAESSADESDLLELGYLYIYYFSDYNDLESWRKKAAPGIIARNILAMEKYAICQEAVELDQAQCILNLARSRLTLTMYFVRYDENETHYQAFKFPGEK